jgi:hypothetical protein
MGIQVGLLSQVGLLIFAHITVEEGDRYDEGCEALMIGGDDLEEFLLFVRREDLLEKPNMCWSTLTCFLTLGFKWRTSRRKVPYRP